MCGEVMVEEQLASHEEERHVVCGPRKEEEACRVIETVAGLAVEGVDAAALCKLICCDDTDEDGENTGGEPPAEWVAKEVDLFAGVVFSPEGDPTEEEWPLYWL